MSSDSAEQLLLSALDLFGRHGFDGVSTRAIARAAGRPMSAITYHFGGKEELYLAVARHIAAHISAQVAPLLAEGATLAPDVAPADARVRIKRFVATVAGVMLNPENAARARFITREQMDPTPAFDELYNGPMGTLLGLLTALVRRVAGDGIGEGEARLRAISLFGQVLVFRVARAAVLRSNGWTEVGPREREHIVALILAQIDAIMDALEARGVA